MSFFRVSQITTTNKVLYTVSTMLFFWAIFDGLLGYLVPIVITQAGFSDTVMGIIFGSSSVIGGLFDFLISKFVSNTYYRRIYFVMFALCFVYPLVLWQAKEIWLFLIAMAIWGIYFDLQNFGTFDFVGRKIDIDAHAQEFGVIFVFKSVGYLIAPLIAGLLIGKIVGSLPYIFSWLLLGIAFIIFLSIIVMTKRKSQKEIPIKEVRIVNLVKELFLWKSIGKLLLPVLVFTMLLNILDAFFWTIGPLVAESFSSLHPFNGIFLVMYELPPLFIGWIVGNFTRKIGKKYTAFAAFLIACLMLAYLPLLSNIFIVLAYVFLASCFISLAWPAINGAYADYISESGHYEREIEGLQDFSTNVGYVIGPILAGFLADRVGNMPAFAYLGFGGVLICILLLGFSPRHIFVSIPRKEKDKSNNLALS